MIDKRDVIYATAILTSLDFCPACGQMKPECLHIRAFRRLVLTAREVVKRAPDTERLNLFTDDEIDLLTCASISTLDGGTMLAEELEAERRRRQV
jgi:hypothetical protein